LPEIIRLLCDKTVSGTVVSTCHPNCSGTWGRMIAWTQEFKAAWAT
jgi:hypothetical protein